MEAKVKQIFDYLLAVNNLRFPSVKKYEQYERFWLDHDFPDEEGCYLFGNGIDNEAWIEIHRQRITSSDRTVPQPPESIEKWIDSNIHDENLNTINIVEKVLTSESEGKEATYEYFEDDKERVLDFERWHKEWKIWAYKLQKKRKIQRLYEQFFDLIQQFKREGEALELILGQGVLTLKHEYGNIKHPTLLIRMDIEFDAAAGVIKLKPNYKGLTLELEMLSGVSIPNKGRINQLREEIKNLDINNINIKNEEVSKYLEQFIHLLHPNGRFEMNSSKVIEITRDPILYNRFVLFVRKKDTQLVKKDLEMIIENLEDGNIVIPQSIQALIGENVEQTKNNEDWELVGHQLFFPLPANEEQKEIARRLSNSFGVTVQGPPGTGKSHTIANLVSHLLAHGKKVLITSQKESPLKVLKDKIPEEIKNLCVPVLGGGRESIKEIEKAIHDISEKMGTLNSTQLHKEIEIAKEQLKQSKRKEAECKHKLKQFFQKEVESVEFEDNEYMRIHAAEKLAKESLDYQWIVDPVPLNESPPLNEIEFSKLWKLRGELFQTDYNLKDYVLPQKENLIDADSFEQWVTNGKELKEKTKMTEDQIHSYGIPLDKEYIQKVKSVLKEVEQDVQLLQSSPNQAIMDDVLNGGERKQTWINFIENAKTTVEYIVKNQRELLDYEFHLPNKNREEIKNDVNILIEQYQKGKPNFLFLLIKGKRIKYLLKENILNGRPVSSKEDLELVLQYLELSETTDRFVRKWNKLMDTIEGKTFEKDEHRLISKIDNKIKELEILIHLAEKIKNIQLLLREIELPASTNWLDSQTYKNLLDVFEKTDDHLRYKTWKIEFSNILKELENHANQKLAHNVWDRLIQAFRYQKVKEWREILDEIEDLISLKQKVVEFDRLLQKWSEKAPQTGRKIMNLLGKDLEEPKNIKQAWKLKGLETWLKETEGFDYKNLENQIKHEQQVQQKLVAEIVSKSTWKNQLDSITDQQKRSLSAWKQYIVKYGKGTGKLAPIYLREARKEMEKCQSAIPVWIMPISQVIENFPVTNEKFDVVIFDESSQCNLFSVPILLRAKKAVVVGDEEQISPYGIGIKKEEINDLMEQYLEDIPNAKLFDMEISLYDIADQIFPKTGRLMLKEHFRCVPEIIQFSNDLSYDGKMIPLRLPSRDEMIEDPVQAIRVEDGYCEDGTDINEPEADVIIEDIKKIIEDPRYEDQTIGVISLQGTKQAPFIEAKLRNVIGEQEFVKRNIICGNAYTLQGDERDIVFLSMVIDENRNFRALTNKKAQQTYNVASSRARNQLRLYHSIDLDQLSKNDYRYRLLSYCQNPARVNKEVQDLEAKCESRFEIDVMRRIVANGYKVTPQVKVGRFRIDLVIEGIRNRLAVECDGDAYHPPEKWEEDMERQYILERAGWTFWRVRGSQFYRDPQKAMESLWGILDEMGIERN